MPAKATSVSPAAPGTRVEEGSIALPAELRLEHGGRVLEGRIAYRLTGTPGAPVVAVLGGISADRVVTAQEGDSDPGWWEWMVGVGHPLDLRVHRVLGIDYLCGCGASTGRLLDAFPPTPDPIPIPLITPTDQAHILAMVVAALGIGPLCGLIGASYGGAVALAFAATHPEDVLRTLVIGAAHRSHPLATALRAVQRRIVQRAVAAGDEAGGIALARALAMTTYRSDREFEERFSGPPRVGADGARFPVEDYIDYHGQTFAGRFTAAQFLCLCLSSDLHFVDPARIRTPVTVVSVEPDFLAPRWQLEKLARLMGAGHKLVRVSSLHGHDAFLTDADAFSQIVRDFIQDCGATADGRS